MTKRSRPYIIVICFTGILAVRLFRSSGIPWPAWFKFLTGILPNFFAASGLPFLFQHIVARPSALKIIRFGWFAVMTFIVLTLWEFAQYALWDYPVDFYDLTATAAGCFLSAIADRLLRG